MQPHNSDSKGVQPPMVCNFFEVKGFCRGNLSFENEMPYEKLVGRDVATSGGSSRSYTPYTRQSEILNLFFVCHASIFNT